MSPTDLGLNKSGSNRRKVIRVPSFLHMKGKIRSVPLFVFIRIKMFLIHVHVFSLAKPCCFPNFGTPFRQNEYDAKDLFPASPRDATRRETNGWCFLRFRYDFPRILRAHLVFGAWGTLARMFFWEPCGFCLASPPPPKSYRSIVVNQ